MKESPIEKIKSLRLKLLEKGFSNKEISENILDIDQRTLSGICTGNRVPKKVSKLKLYINTMERYL